MLSGASAAREPVEEEEAPLARVPDCSATTTSVSRSAHSGTSSARALELSHSKWLGLLSCVLSGICAVHGQSEYYCHRTATGMSSEPKKSQEETGLVGWYHLVTTSDSEVSSSSRRSAGYTLAVGQWHLSRHYYYYYKRPT